MLKLLRRIFTPKEHVHFIPRMPVGLEISDGDHARLYGWPDLYIEEVMEHEA